MYEKGKWIIADLARRNDTRCILDVKSISERGYGGGNADKKREASHFIICPIRVSRAVGFSDPRMADICDSGK